MTRGLKANAAEWGCGRPGDICCQFINTGTQQGDVLGEGTPSLAGAALCWG